MNNTDETHHNQILKQEIQNLAFVTAPMVIVCTNADGDIIMINPAVRTLFGYLEGEMEGSSFLKLVPELEKLEYESFEEFSNRGDLEMFDTEDSSISTSMEDYNFLEKFIYGRMDGEQYQEIKTRTSDNEPIWVEMYCFRVTIEGEKYFIVVIHDTTEKKVNEQEVLALNTMLESKVRELRENCNV